VRRSQPSSGDGGFGVGVVAGLILCVMFLTVGRWLFDLAQWALSVDVVAASISWFTTPQVVSVTVTPARLLMQLLPIVIILTIVWLMIGMMQMWGGVRQ